MKPGNRSARIVIQMDQANFDRASEFACKEALTRLADEFEHLDDSLQLTFLDYSATRKKGTWQHVYCFDAYIESPNVNEIPPPPRSVAPVINTPIPLALVEN